MAVAVREEESRESTFDGRVEVDDQDLVEWDDRGGDADKTGKSGHCC